METTDYYVNPLGSLIYPVDGYNSLISGVVCYTSVIDDEPFLMLI